MQAFRHPDLPMPFPYSPPNRAMAAEPMWEWLDEFGLVRDKTVTDLLKSTRAELTTALTFPTVSAAQLEAFSQFMAWAFLVDDEFDDGPAGRDVDHAERAVSRLCEVLGACLPAGLTPLEAALSHVWRRIAAGRSPGWQRAFVADVTSWLLTYPTEARHRNAGWLPSLGEYLVHRRHSVGVLMFMDLCEPAAEIDLPAQLRTLPAMTQMRNATAEYVGVLNDIHSLRKELPIGYVHNTVNIVLTAERCSLQAAVDRAGQLATDRLQTFFSAEQELEIQLAAAGVSDAARHAVKRCVEAYHSVIRGNYDYHLMAERYTKADERIVKAA